VRISRIRLTDSLLATGSIEELKTVRLQVNQTIALKSGIQAFAFPEGFAPSLAPIVQKPLKANSGVMVHISKYFPGIPVVEVVTPSPKDAVYFANYMDKASFVTATGLYPKFLFECRYGLCARHDVEVIPISSVQVSVIAKGEPQKVKALFLVHSDNSGFVPVYAESKFAFKFLFQPSGDALSP